MSRQSNPTLIVVNRQLGGRFSGPHARNQYEPWYEGARNNSSGKQHRVQTTNPTNTGEQPKRRNHIVEDESVSGSRLLTDNLLTQTNQQTAELLETDFDESSAQLESQQIQLTEPSPGGQRLPINRGSFEQLTTCKAGDVAG